MFLFWWLQLLLCLSVFGQDEAKTFSLTEPIQLVRPNGTHSGLEIVESSMQILQDISTTVAVVAVVGPYHSGKSFLLNQLMGHSKGFGVGRSVAPETMGIWLWGGEKLKLQDGSEATILYLDTEGFSSSNVSQHYDSQIFAVSTLLSSYLIYNSVKIIDQTAIDYLELLTTQAQMFSLNTQLSPDNIENGFDMNMIKFPPLLWVVEDFYQELIEGETPQQWLDRLLTLSYEEDNQRQLTKLFPSVNCHTLFLPAVSRNLLLDLSLSTESDLTKDYIRERDELKKIISENIRPKTKHSHGKVSFVNGQNLVSLLRLLVSGTNEGQLAEIPSIWKSWIQDQAETTLNQCFSYYKRYMDMKLHEAVPAMTVSSLETYHLSIKKDTEDLLENLLLGLEKNKVSYNEDLTQRIESRWRKTEEQHKNRILQLLSDESQKMADNVSEKYKALILPQPSKNLKDVLEMAKEEAIELYQNLHNAYNDVNGYDQIVDNLKDNLNAKIEEIHKSNNYEIQERLKKIKVEAIRNFENLLETEDEGARLQRDLDSLFKKSQETTDEFFQNKLNQFADEPLVAEIRTLFQNERQRIFTDICQKNSDAVRLEIQSKINILMREVNGTKVYLPKQEADLTKIIEDIALSYKIKFSNFVSKFDIPTIVNEKESVFEKNLQDFDIQTRKRNDEILAEISRKYLDPLRFELGEMLEDWSSLLPNFIPIYSFKSRAMHLCTTTLRESNDQYLDTEAVIWRISEMYVQKFQETTKSQIYIFLTLALATLVTAGLGLNYRKH